MGMKECQIWISCQGENFVKGSNIDGRKWSVNCELPSSKISKGNLLLWYSKQNTGRKRIGNWLELMKLEGSVLEVPCTKMLIGTPYPGAYPFLCRRSKNDWNKSHASLRVETWNVTSHSTVCLFVLSFPNLPGFSLGIRTMTVFQYIILKHWTWNCRLWEMDFPLDHWIRCGVEIHTPWTYYRILPCFRYVSFFALVQRNKRRWSKIETNQFWEKRRRNCQDWWYNFHDEPVI